MKMTPREQEVILTTLDDALRTVFSPGVEIIAVHRLKSIVNIHCPDEVGRCAACDLPHPCRTYRMAFGERG